MLLSELIAGSLHRAPDLGWEISPDAGDPSIASMRLDSRGVQPGDLFLCVPGDVTDGHNFASKAIEAGAVALVVDRWLDMPVPQVRVTDVRSAMAHISNMFFGDPSRELQVIGITGTNGKTTTAHLVKAILDHTGVPCGLLGTLSGARTTPEAPHLQGSLRAMVDEGMRAVAIEVSSHALVQGRVTGMNIDVGVFTNLSPDHLDYHGTLDDYFEAKSILFRAGLVDVAVINTDDPRGAALIESLDVPATGYSRALLEDVEVTMSGSEFTWRGHRVTLALPGLFNMENAVAAAEAVRLLGIDDGSIAAGLSAAAAMAATAAEPPWATFCAASARCSASCWRAEERSGFSGWQPIRERAARTVTTEIRMMPLGAGLKRLASTHSKLRGSSLSLEGHLGASPGPAPIPCRSPRAPTSSPV